MMNNEPINVLKINSVIEYNDISTKKNITYGSILYHNEIIYRLEGECNVFFNKKRYHEEKDSLRIMSAGRIATNSYFVERIEPYSKVIDIFFDTDFPLPNDITVINFQKDHTMRILFEKIQKIWHYKNNGYYQECMSILYKILALIEKRNYVNVEKSILIQPAIDYINNHFTEQELKCSELSSLCKISYSYLKKIFIQKYGIPPIQYINQKRISYSCDLIISGLYPLSKIAEMTGFESEYYLSRVFKKLVGISPKQYKIKNNSK